MTRRMLLGSVAAAAVSHVSAQTAPRKMRLGIILGLGKDPDAALRRVHDLGLPTCQFHPGDMDDAAAAQVRQAAEKYSVELTAVVFGGPGREIYNFYEGPLTIGLVPRATRDARLARIKAHSDFAKKVGVTAVMGHCGFIPEDPNEPLYAEAVAAIRTAAQYCKENGQRFRCETGQETPITLVRTIRDVGLDNIGVNFDVANLILYGKGNPVDAIDVLGPYIEGVHAKDGLYPTDPKQLGREVPIGEGKVNFPALIAGLKRIGYANPLTIEREISGDKQRQDILAAKAYLEKLIG